MVLQTAREMEKNNHPIATMSQSELTHNSTTELDSLFFPSTQIYGFAQRKFITLRIIDVGWQFIIRIPDDH